MNPYYVAVSFAGVIMVMGVVIALGMVYVGLISQNDDGDPFDVYPEEDEESWT